MTDANAQLAPIRRLIAEVVDSFEKLEIILHLARISPARAQQAELASALGLPARTLADALAELAQSALIVMKEREGGWSLDPHSPWASSAEALARLYDDDRVRVLDIMTHTALERVRTQAARAFADAFVLRSRKKDRDG